MIAKVKCLSSARFNELCFYSNVCLNIDVVVDVRFFLSHTMRLLSNVMLGGGGNSVWCISVVLIFTNGKKNYRQNQTKRTHNIKQ